MAAGQTLMVDGTEVLIQELMVAAYQLWLALAYRLPALVGTPMTRWMARQLRAPAPPQAIGAQMNYTYVAQWLGLPTSGA